MTKLRALNRFAALVLAAWLGLAATEAGAETAGGTPAAPVTRPTDGIVGKIIEVEGTATVTPRNGQAVTAAVNTPLHLDDEIKTEAGARLFLLFIDNTQMTLAENTQMWIDDYVFDPEVNKENRARYSVLQGAFQYVSGLIGHKDNPDVKIQTQVGSIGIRGTDFWAGKLDDRFSVAVNEGQVGLKTQAGSEAVVTRGEGTSVQDRMHAPAPPQHWNIAQFHHVAETVHLKNYAQVMQRVAAAQAGQQALRQNYKSFMSAHRRDGEWEGMPGRCGTSCLKNQMLQEKGGSRGRHGNHASPGRRAAGHAGHGGSRAHIHAAKSHAASPHSRSPARSGKGSAAHGGHVSGPRGHHGKK